MSKFFISGRDLPEIWLRGQILGADFESEVIFHIGPISNLYWPFLAILPSLLNNRVAMATIQDINEQSYIFGCFIHRL